MININLLPPEIKSKIRQIKKSADIFSICLIVVIIFAVSGFILEAFNKQLMIPNLNNIKDQIQKTSVDFKSFETLENDALFLNDRAQLAVQIEVKRPVWSQIMQELINCVPQTVQFVSLNADLGQTPNFVLEGNTTSEREIIKFKEKLENSDFFKNVSFKSASTTTPSGQQPAQPSTDTTISQIHFSLEFDLEKYAAGVITTNKENQ